tara:strand:- start:43 stop:246 length:204 start_codon:yes stop_codon:yes gene_type:complete
MQTLKEQNIDIKQIDYVSFERPAKCLVVLFKNGSLILKGFEQLSNKQIKMLEKFEKTDLDIEFEELN